jgi:hypothetical protein
MFAPITVTFAGQLRFTAVAGAITRFVPNDIVAALIVSVPAGISCDELPNTNAPVTVTVAKVGAITENSPTVRLPKEHVPNGAKYTVLPNVAVPLTTIGVPPPNHPAGQTSVTQVRLVTPVISHAPALVPVWM